MARKSSSVEEKARDALCKFLLSLQRRPLAKFLALFFPRNLPRSFAEVTTLSVETEVETNLGSRVDLVVVGAPTVLFVEVKVDAVEQVGQYEKYKHYFESKGYTVTAGGLINRSRKANKKDNVSFLETLGVRRVYWSEVLATLEQTFGGTKEFKRFRAKLATISPTIGFYTPTQILKLAQIERRNSALLPSGNNELCIFYNDLLSRLKGMEGSPWQHGNSPYCLMFGKHTWKETFHEGWFYRAFICVNKQDSAESNFSFSVMLWNRGWTTNMQWFFAHRASLIQYFTGLGFDVGRNEGSGWHRKTSWLPPYDVKGLKYANAFWKPRIPLRNDDRAVTPWDTLLNRSLDGCFGLTKIVDGLSVE